MDVDGFELNRGGADVDPVGLSTRALLERISDPGRFEALAAAVLRAALPEIAALAETGTNASNRPQAGPLDGIAFAPVTIGPPHLFAVHHTTTVAPRLRGKWLAGMHAPDDKMSAEGLGDIPKTMRVVREERARTPDLKATLLLTTTREPDESLVRDVHAAVDGQDIIVDLWPASRIAHFLDFNAEGQEIRRAYFGKPQTRLSPARLFDLSRRALEAAPPRGVPQIWVNRRLDLDIDTSIHRMTTFVVAASGSGKSVACHRALARHVAAGGWGLVVSDPLIAAAPSLIAATDAALRELDPSLVGPGEGALAMASDDRPLLLVVEDVNRSDRPTALLEKLAGWSSDDKGNPLVAGRVRILCPVWPEHVRALDDATQKRVWASAVLGGPFEEAEGESAVQVRAQGTGRALTSSEARSLSASLGHDPLLIGLYDFDEAPEAATVVADWMAKALERAARLRSQGHLAVEYYAALLALARTMIERRQMAPTWRDLSEWPELQPSHLPALRDLVRQGEVVRAEGPVATQRVAFRHDRVRDWLLVEAFTELLTGGRLPDHVVDDPWFARLLGEVAACDRCPLTFVDRLSSTNPLALAHALRALRGRAGSRRSDIVGGLERWLEAMKTFPLEQNHLRWSIIQALQMVDDPAVPSLVVRLDRHGHAGAPARLRNGDVAGGIILCSTMEPGVGAPWRDIQIEQGLARHGPTLKRNLARALEDATLQGAGLLGAVRLAGHFGDPALGTAVFKAWSRDDGRDTVLGDYIWALARCCDEDPGALMEPALEAWATLPDERADDMNPGARTQVADHALRFAFRAWPPRRALTYLADRASDPRIGNLIAWIMLGVDDPQALGFVVRYFGAQDRAREGSGGFRIPLLYGEWRHAQNNGRPMSEASRTVLRSLWEDEENDRFDRRVAFDLWAATQAHGDVATLRKPTIAELADPVLSARLERRDIGAVPDLLQRLNDCRSHWRYSAWRMPTEQVLAWLENKLLRPTDCDNDKGLDDLGSWAADLLTRAPTPRAEEILVRGWGVARRTPCLVQAALFHATPRLLEMAEGAIQELQQVMDPFELISSRFGFMMSDHPGMTREAQAHALIPYLDRLDEHALYSFWEAVNRRGWFNFRRQYLDARFPAKYRRGPWRPDLFVASLDEALSRRSAFFVELEVRDLLKSDTPWPAIGAKLTEWLATQTEHQALRIAARIVGEFGVRTDLALLDVWPGAMDHSAADIISDATFMVMLRSLT